MEVSSPGLGRTLKKDKDFVREMGKEVEVKLYKAIEKRKDFSGTLVAFDKDMLTIEEDGNTLTFSRKDIANVRLAIDF